MINGCSLIIILVNKTYLHNIYVYILHALIIHTSELTTTEATTSFCLLSLLVTIISSSFLRQPTNPTAATYRKGRSFYNFLQLKRVIYDISSCDYDDISSQFLLRFPQTPHKKEGVVWYTPCQRYFAMKCGKMRFVERYSKYPIIITAIMLHP